MEDTPDGKISQFLVAADRIAYINPANGNETPGFVMQGDQIIMNEAFLKYLSAPTITSGGNPPAFSLTPDGKLTAKNADISGHINAVSGSFTGEINATSGKFSGVIEAREFVGDICGSKVMQGVSIRATNDERSTSTRYTDSATYQIGKTITVMANCERNGGTGAITVTININGHVSDRRLFGLHHFTCRGYQRLSEGPWAVHHVCFRLAAGDGFPVGEQLHKLTGFTTQQPAIRFISPNSARCPKTSHQFHQTVNTRNGMVRRG